MEASLDNGIEKIKERCSLLKHQIQMKAKSLINKISMMNDEMQDEIDEYELECIGLFEMSNETKKTLKDRINEKRSFCEMSSKYLSQFRIDDDEVSKLINKSIETLNSCKQLNQDINELTYSNRHFKIDEDEKKLDSSIIGCFQMNDPIFRFDSIILTGKQDMYGFA
jgi:hypothetical protein